MDVERIVVDHLNASDIGAMAYYDVPPNRPSEFVVVERTGGYRSDLVVETPMVDVKCWGKERRTAAQLADRVVSAVESMPESVDECFHASVTSTFRDVDVDSGSPRYHVVFELTLVDN